MRDPGALRGWHVLTMLLASFAIVFAVNGIFIALALKSFPGEDQPKSYAQGVDYNSTLRDRQIQARLNWRATAAIETDEAGRPVVRVALRDSNGRPLDGLDLSGSLRRPTDATLDRALAFAPMGEGRYRAAAEGLHEGQWALVLRAARGREHLDVQKRLVWQSPRS